jgi:hypothetical protein
MQDVDDKAHRFPYNQRRGRGVGFFFFFKCIINDLSKDIVKASAPSKET